MLAVYCRLRSLRRYEKNIKNHIPQNGISRFGNTSAISGACSYDSEISEIFCIFLWNMRVIKLIGSYLYNK